MIDYHQQPIAYLSFLFDPRGGAMHMLWLTRTVTNVVHVLTSPVVVGTQLFCVWLYFREVTKPHRGLWEHRFYTWMPYFLTCCATLGTWFLTPGTMPRYKFALAQYSASFSTYSYSRKLVRMKQLDDVTRDPEP